METISTNQTKADGAGARTIKLKLNCYIFPTILSAVAVLLVTIIPSLDSGTSNIPVLSLFGTIYFVFLAVVFFNRNEETPNRAISDITVVLLFLLLVWEMATNRFGWATGFIYPTPEAVISQFTQDGKELFYHLVSSVGLLASGYSLAVLFGISLGTLSAWYRRLGRIMNPASSVLAPIPPIILIPYAIALLPSFRASSIFIIFIGAFWPIFVATLNGVAGIDRRYVDSARTLGVSTFTLFRKIIFPAALSSIFTGLTIGMTLSFILLTSAEMIGANAGVGFYIKLATDFGNYTKVVTGIIFIGIFVTFVMILLRRLEKHFLRWQR